MPAPASTVLLASLKDILVDDLAVDLNAAATDTFKVALFNNSMDSGSTFVRETNPGTYNSGIWVNTNEVSGSGYTAGGKGLTAPTLTAAAASGAMTWAPGLGTVEWTATLSGVRCLLHYHVSTNRGICVNNLGADFASIAGTFSVEYGANGIFRVELP